MNNTTAIEVKELFKSYGENTVLKGISFSAKKGEMLAILGANGAGKTTLLECIEGLRRYNSGEIFVDGKSGIQLQSASLPEHIRVIEAVRLFAKWNKTEIDEKMLEALGINGLAKKQYADMSTGQKRRLHLALCLIGNPDIIFLDEPTAGLDIEGRISLHEHIRRLKAQGKTIILASHDMAEVETLCDKIAILNDGKLAFMGTADELAQRVGFSYTINIRTEQGEQSFNSSDIGETMLTMLEEYKQKGVKVLDIKIDHGTLEQQFIEIARRDNK